MKILILAFVCVLCIAFSYGDEVSAQHRANELINECKEELKPTDEDLQPLRNKQLPTTENGKCLLGCILTKAGYLKDGVYQKDYVQDRIRNVYQKSPERVEKALEELATCDSKVTSTNKCEAATQLYPCIRLIANYEPKW